MKKTIKDIDWGDGQYSCYRADFSRLFSIDISYSDGGYVVRIIGTRASKLRDSFKDLDDAKKAGIRVAKRMIYQINKELMEIE